MTNKIKLSGTKKVVAIETPAGRVAEQKIQLRKMLAALNEEFANYGDGESKNYGHVGSLGHAVEKLEELCRTFQVVVSK